MTRIAILIAILLLAGCAQTVHYDSYGLGYYD